MVLRSNIQGEVKVWSPLIEVLAGRLSRDRKRPLMVHAPAIHSSTERSRRKKGEKRRERRKEGIKGKQEEKESRSGRGRRVKEGMKEDKRKRRAG